jgi:hypothetical protein
MKGLIPAASWLRAALLVASGLVLTVILAAVCVKILSSEEQLQLSESAFIYMDESSFRQAIQVDKLYEGIDHDFLVPVPVPAEVPADDPLLGLPSLASR